MIVDGSHPVIANVISCDHCFQMFDELNIGAFTVDTGRKVSAINLSAQALLGLKEKSEQAMELLLNYHYPGNVREVENILEHALIVCKEEIVQPGHLPEYLRHQRIPSGQSLLPEEDGVSREKEEILRALRHTRGNRKKAARALEMDRTTLWRKMKKLGLRV